MMLPIVTAVIIAIFVFGFGGLATRVGPRHRNLRKPGWNPPNWVFGPAWAIILSLAACSGILAWINSSDAAIHLRIAVLFGINIILQILWSPLFFYLQRPDWALLEIVFLWLSIVALMFGLEPVSSNASLLLLPYLLWVAFAAILNLVIVRMNSPFANNLH
jgi:tryptophan-rich sensory protein